MKNRRIYIPVEISHWKRERVKIPSVGFNSIDECKLYFDENHKCEKSDYSRCDYCDEKWKTKDGELKKIVDYDGAVVEYIITKIIIKP